MWSFELKGRGKIRCTSAGQSDSRWVLRGSHGVGGGMGRWVVGAFSRVGMIQGSRRASRTGN